MLYINSKEEHKKWHNVLGMIPVKAGEPITIFVPDQTIGQTGFTGNSPSVNVIVVSVQLIPMQLTAVAKIKLNVLCHVNYFKIGGESEAIYFDEIVCCLDTDISKCNFQYMSKDLSFKVELI